MKLTAFPAAKRCVTCGQTKPAADFYLAPQNRDGLRGRCKSCCKAESARRYAQAKRQIARILESQGSREVA